MEKDRVIIVDATNQYYKNYFALGNLTYEGVKVGGMYGYIRNVGRKLETIGNGFENTYHVFDLKGSRRKREIMFSDYKANRPKMADEGFFDMINELKMFLKSMGAYVVEKEGFEADELIALLTRRFSREGKKVIIISDDSDLFQLTEYENVEIHTSHGVVTRKELLAEYGIYGRDFMLAKALAGDKADNIPPVEKGMGLKTASKVIRMGKLMAYEGMEEFERNKSLINLLDLEDAEIELVKHEKNLNVASSILMRYKMNSLLKTLR